MIREAIILAGGLGTRLRSVVNDVPKCMAPVNGRPFLAYIMSYLQKQGVERFVFSLGFKSEIIVDFLKTQYTGLDIETVTEKEPLGTGGAIKLACDAAKSRDVLILNGDTLFDIDLQQLSSFHHYKKANCSIALKPMREFSRYGSVEIDGNNRIMAFNEKKFCKEGLINGGIYALKKRSLLEKDLPGVFSFEKEFLEKNTGHGLYAMAFDNYFIDIGIPEDYERAQTELKEIL
ncbi:MAG: nucleotidyltransferase family protein [Ferruginibacter sp.]